MKKTLKSYTFVMLFLLITTFISSLILTFLHNGELISWKSGQITTNILSLSLFFISSIILGMKQKNKGLINGIVFALLYVSLCLFIHVDLSTVTNIIEFIGKIFLIILGNIIGVNLKK